MFITFADNCQAASASLAIHTIRGVGYILAKDNE